MAEDTRENKSVDESSKLESSAPVEDAEMFKERAANETDDNGAPQEKERTSNLSVDSSNLHYEGNVCVYTDPVSKCEYLWNSDKTEWELRPKNVEEESNDKNVNINDGVASKPAENIAGIDYEFDGESYCYKDSKTGHTYRYDNVRKEWVIKELKDDDRKDRDKKVSKDDAERDSDDSDKDGKDRVIKQDMTSGTYGFEGDTHTYTDPTDGTVYIWDKEKNAWFPKVDEDFLAHYQMNYGFVASNSSSTKEETKSENENNSSAEDSVAMKRKAPQEPNWFEMDDQHNTKVYVTNLPLDITEQEFIDVMQKCGLVMKDVDTGKMKIKLYTEPGTNQLKGDGLCTYIKIESVDLALKLLDGYDLRGHKLHVERAKFQMKGNYDPNLKPKKRKKKDKEKLKKMQEKLFDWRPDKLRGERSKHEKVVIVKNLFDPKIFDKEVSLILEYQQDLREECSKCGDVRRVTIYDRHPEGVAQINFREPEEADACVALLNGRWFGQRKITAETWDGKTKYKIVETEAEAQQRLEKWEKFIESEAAKSTDEKKVESSEKTPTDSRHLSGESVSSHVTTGSDSVNTKDCDSSAEHKEDGDSSKGRGITDFLNKNEENRDATTKKNDV